MAVVLGDHQTALQLEVALFIKAGDFVDPPITNATFVIDSRASEAKADLVTDGDAEFLFSINFKAIRRFDRDRLLGSPFDRR
ncbi:hypothetical protein [Adhaeretor mobilis]|uniref:hypothetical protein n=1 Tax=Adhaeretor mobilis TaxID=1930276 RepID=UPI0011A7E264|nr:hypothetical protein [Adhaeretor mobilis]